MSAPTAAKEQEEEQLKQPTKSMLKQPTKSMLEQLPVDRDGARDLLKDEGWMSQWSQCVDYLLVPTFSSLTLVSFAGDEFVY
jgi:hypothetical protein